MKRAIDHLVLCVRDLHAARAAYRRLGFTLTPVARHPWGTENSLVQLHGNFLELLAIGEPRLIPAAAPGEFSFGEFSRNFLLNREGMAMLVFASGDARADQREFMARGLETYAPFEFSRRAKLPDGGEATVAFSLAFVTDPRMPQAAFFTCQQHAPEHFWKPEYQHHANGAARIREVLMRAADPAQLADFFVGLVEPGALRRDAGSLVVSLGRGRLTILDPARLAERFPAASFNRLPATPAFAGYAIEVADVAAMAADLARAGVPFRTASGRLQIEAAHGFGVAIEFAAADQPAPSASE